MIMSRWSGRLMAVLLVLTMCFGLCSCGAAKGAEEEAPAPTEANIAAGQDKETEPEEVLEEVLEEEETNLITNQEAVKAREEEIRIAAGERAREILDSDSAIVKSDTLILGETYTGTAYYISSSEGSDDNDGLSPETPFRTLERPNWDGQLLKSGDIVYLKRGDVWQGETLATCEGVTYSAYGEGPKPVIEAAAVDGCDPADWELYLEDGDRKIWKFVRDTQEVAGIYFNDGESYAVRAFGWWVNDHYVNLTVVNTGDNPRETDSWEVYTDGSEQTVENCLTEDLMFCYMADYTGVDYPVEPESFTGPVYLRCDQGNPALVFDSVKFASGYRNPTELCSYNCIDNISIRYFLQWGIGLDVTRGYHDFVIQNCEIAYGGNHYHEYWSEEPSRYFAFGDAIYGLGQNAVIRNNYIHDVDCYAMALELETFEGGDYVSTGNLIERCGDGIGLCAFVDDDWSEVAAKLDTVTITDNLVLDLGEGWVHAGQSSVQYLCLLVKDVDLTVKDNIFCGTQNRVAELYDVSFQKSYDVDGNCFFIPDDMSEVFFFYDSSMATLSATNNKLIWHIGKKFGDENVTVYLQGS